MVFVFSRKTGEEKIQPGKLKYSVFVCLFFKCICYAMEDQRESRPRLKLGRQFVVLGLL